MATSEGLSGIFRESRKQPEIDGISDFVFTNGKGKPYPTNAINFVLDNIVKKCNILEAVQADKEGREPENMPHISAHTLRHTACTRPAEFGLEPKVLQYIMGHANISVTLDIYAHLDFTQIQEKMEAVEERTRTINLRKVPFYRLFINGLRIY